jgi:hypothetical protein
MTWRTASIAYTEQAFNQLSGERPELTTDEVLDVVNREHYPFGERAMHPYKMWLKAMRDYRAYARKRWPERGKSVVGVQGEGA